MITAAATAFRICSPDGNQLQQFTHQGDHQMLVQCFAWTAAGWEQTKGGWMWIGAARLRWQDLQRQGWSRVV